MVGLREFKRAPRSLLGKVKSACFITFMSDKFVKSVKFILRVIKKSESVHFFSVIIKTSSLRMEWKWWWGFIINRGNCNWETFDERIFFIFLNLNLEMKKFRPANHQKLLKLAKMCFGVYDKEYTTYMCSLLYIAL